MNTRDVSRIRSGSWTCDARLIEPDPRLPGIGGPSVSFNALTGHRSCVRRITAEICALCGRDRYRFQASFRQARILAFWRLGFRQCGFRHIARTSRHTAPYAWARLPVSWHAIVPGHLSDHGSAIRSKDTSSSPCPLRGLYSSAPRGARRLSDSGRSALTPACGQSNASLAPRRLTAVGCLAAGVAALRPCRAQCRDLCAACSIQLREDVCRDFLEREHQLPGDLPAGEVGRDELGDLEPCHPRISGPRESVTLDR